MSRFSEADQTHFVSGRQTLGRSEGASEAFAHHFGGGGGRTSVLNVRSEADPTQRDL